MTSATKRKSEEMTDAYPQDVTPTNSPSRKRMRITRSQKQNLMDNLQLELTERARKLRAQYALQAQDLRARIERRVNRIPVALRKAQMGELLEKQNASLRSQQENSPKNYRSPVKSSRNFTAASASGRKKAATVSPSPRRVRKHSPAGIYSDKENAPASGEQLDVLKNPKRRTKPGAAAGTSRVVSQGVRGADSRILSPKSSNSRTYPQSPLRASPEKGQFSAYLSRPMSPLKPSSPLKSTTGNYARPGSSRGTASSRPASAQSKRPASRAATAGPKSIRSPLSRPGTRQAERRGSFSSTTSSGTTVATTSKTNRKVTSASTASAAAKKATVARSQASTAGKKSAASGPRKTTASASSEPTTGGRRVLRKRA